MFGVLLESRARRQRHTGGAVLSTATHLGIIGAVTAFTVGGPTGPAHAAKPVIVPVAFARKAPPPRHQAAPSSRAPVSPTAIAPPNVPVIDVPQTIPVGIPPIDPSSGFSLDSLLIGGSRAGPHQLGGSLIADGTGDAADDWHGSRLLMRIITSVKPRYPESLRQAGISGRVVVRFTVDTLGRVDPATVTVVESTHERFTSAVRVALAGFRFRPANVGERRVAALAEMPFEFQVTR